MPLNYNKWDKLEVSDDSDIEGHPNVDHKSLVRWRQRDIHEKREARKAKIAALKSEIEMNGVLGPRIDEIVASTRREGQPFIQRTVAQLRVTSQQPARAGDRPTGSKGPTYDAMVLDLIMQVVEEVRAARIEGDATVEAIAKRVQKHRDQLDERTEQCRKLIVEEEAEQRKLITSEDMHEGYSNSHVSKDAATKQIVDEPKRPAAPAPAADVKGKGKAIEVLNPKGAASASPPAASGEDSDEEVPSLSANAANFAKIPVNKWDKLFGAISNDPSLLQPRNTDAMLVAAFNAAMKGDAVTCRQNVHNGLVLQYCVKLGRDGVALFFKRMQAGPAKDVFLKDVQETSARIWKRGNELAAEDKAAGDDTGDGGREQIQLVASDPSVVISFDVPDGPPPEHLTLEGEGTENLDVEEVKAFLQQRWEAFDSLPKNMKTALQANDLEQVNRVLGRMSVEQAEEIVGVLDSARILHFSQSGVVDTTKGEVPNPVV